LLIIACYVKKRYALSGLVISNFLGTQEMNHPRDFDRVQNISPGKHLYQFYRDASDYLPLMTAYFRAGLAQGHACLWLVAKHVGVEKAYQALKQQVPELDICIADGSMRILNAEDWYLTEGRFDSAKAQANSARQYERITAAGFSVLRGAGDVAAIPVEDWPIVHEYECAIGSWINSNPVIGLCAYPIAQCTLSQTKHVLETHDDVLAGAL